mgnify:CR=1 FL=1
MYNGNKRSDALRGNILRIEDIYLRNIFKETIIIFIKDNMKKRKSNRVIGQDEGLRRNVYG